MDIAPFLLFSISLAGTVKAILDTLSEKKSKHRGRILFWQLVSLGFILTAIGYAML